MKKQIDQITLATKVAQQFAAIVQMIAERNGMTVSELIANALEVIVKLSSVRDINDPRLKGALLMWEATETKKTNLLQNIHAEVLYAIYLMNQKGRKGLEAVMVESGAQMFGELVTKDANLILETVLKALLPNVLERLNRIREDLETTNTLDTLLTLLDYYETNEDTDHNFIQEMFNEQSSYENNRNLNDVVKYRRKIHKGIDYEQRQRLQSPDLFDQMEDTGEEDEATHSL